MVSIRSGIDDEELLFDNIKKHEYSVICYLNKQIERIMEETDFWPEYRIN